MQTRREGKIAKKRREQIFRCGVEVRKLQDGSIRTLPMTGVMMVSLVSSKIASQQSDRLVLRIQDDHEILEADDFAELRAQLRQRYPDDTYQRIAPRGLSELIPAESLPRTRISASFGTRNSPTSSGGDMRCRETPCRTTVWTYVRSLRS